MVKEMLSVLMDGIKDANMNLDYADKAKSKNDDTYDWFKEHANRRIMMLAEDYKRINQEVMMDEKAAQGDAIAMALSCHLKHEMEMLKNRYNSI